MSVWIIDLIVAGACLQTVGNLIQLVLMLYIQIEYTKLEDFQHDVYHKTSGFTFWFFFFNTMIGYTEIYIGYTIYLTQVYEWISMIFIIRFQNGKTIAEIMHDASVSKYRNRELLYRKVFYGSVGLVWLLAIWLLLNNSPILNVLDENG